MSTPLEKLSPWLFTIGLFVLWELACRIFNVDTFVLPAPSQIFEAAVRYWSPLLKNSFVTLWTTLAGFALALAVLTGLPQEAVAEAARSLRDRLEDDGPYLRAPGADGRIAPAMDLFETPRRRQLQGRRRGARSLSTGRA